VAEVRERAHLARGRALRGGELGAVRARRAERGREPLDRELEPPFGVYAVVDAAERTVAEQPRVREVVRARREVPAVEMTCGLRIGRLNNDV